MEAAPVNLVVGATGLVGGAVCRRLLAAGKPVRALVRPTADRAKVQALEAKGAALAEGDLKDGLSLDRACRGVSAVISTASATLSRQSGDSIETVDRDGQIRLVDAAKAAGAERFVFISFRKNPHLDHPLHAAKRAVEEHLSRSGLVYTILEASYFMEVWLSPAVGFDAANGRARIYGSGRNKISWISFEDVAQFAVAPLDQRAWRNAVIQIGGPDALSPLEVVRIFEEVGGRPFSVEHVPEEALRAQKAAATDSLQESFAGLMLGYARGDAIDMEATLRTFPLQLTSVRHHARRSLAA